ncbi:MAG: hypothetical protein QOD07_1231 [Frankiaceae bacterium]|jgi:hypothetical protein|nr:hypothetical protein [Frankiaceae bacterium]
MLAIPVTTASASTRVTLSVSGTRAFTIWTAKATELQDSQLTFTRGTYAALTDSSGTGFVQIRSADLGPLYTMPVGSAPGAVDIPAHTWTRVAVITDGRLSLSLPAGSRWRTASMPHAAQATLSITPATPDASSPAAAGSMSNKTGGRVVATTAIVGIWDTAPLTGARSADACLAAEPVADCTEYPGNSLFSMDEQFLTSDGGFGLDRYSAGRTYLRPQPAADVAGYVVAPSVLPMNRVFLVAFATNV